MVATNVEPVQEPQVGRNDEDESQVGACAVDEFDRGEQSVRAAGVRHKNLDFDLKHLTRITLLLLQLPLSARTFSPTSATMPNGAAGALGTTDASAISNLTNYSQLMVEARKSASVYSLVRVTCRYLLHFVYKDLR